MFPLMSSLDPEARPAEIDGLPSGRWVGYYVYAHYPSRHRMDLRLEISPDRISGTGIDPVGRFMISGRLREDRSLNWVKTYFGRHDVLYAGFADHNGIWGTWEIPQVSTGGFRIWPAQWGEGFARKMEEKAFTEYEDSVPDAVAGERVLDRV
jgi:hypothetical protein